MESPGDGATALAGGQAPECLTCSMVTATSTSPFADARNSSGQLNPSKPAFELTPWQVRPSLAAMVRSKSPGLP